MSHQHGLNGLSTGAAGQPESVVELDRSLPRAEKRARKRMQEARWPFAVKRPPAAQRAIDDDRHLEREPVGVGQIYRPGNRPQPPS